ncbi:hypothetical protein D8674_028481 [Pyrus ussuriensis x Pyrus communis]|uniref:Uncharacterized protein n=1 Tax=Pyrus ussuriensis x Pyrus communis TaxID=2448454 RepID=A0A5N5I9S9_9ROSA|nr:hypothetical protein D8674_028481 [Pyrus ussuriensis x Pyrus communis]
MNVAQTEDSFIMKPIDQRERTRNRNDIQTSRMKNRERQRRYRARKRLEADLKKSSIIRQPTTPEVEVQRNEFIYTPRVYCKRDWKKDARSAHAFKAPEFTHNGYAIPTLTSISEGQSVFLSGPMAELQLDSESRSEMIVNQNNCEMHVSNFGRRDWKADARKKKI